MVFHYSKNTMRTISVMALQIDELKIPCPKKAGKEF